MHSVRTFLILVASIGSAFHASAEIISINFVGGQGGAAGAASVINLAGVAPAINWNNLAPASQASPLNVINSAGNLAASITYSSPNNWAATGTSPGGGADAALMSGYLDNFSGGGQNIVISGLGADFTLSGYSVIIYQNSDSAGSWGYTVADNASHTGTFFGRQLAGNGGSYPLAGGTNGYIQGVATVASGGATASNYVRIDGLTGSSFTITGVAGTTGDGRVRPNGFQIVSVPEPAAFGIMMLGAAVLGLRRRRS